MAHGFVGAPSRLAHMTVISFHVLVNFTTQSNTYHPTLIEALRAVDHVGQSDEWAIREVMNGSMCEFITGGFGASVRPAA